jgi:hypothetical protein
MLNQPEIRIRVLRPCRIQGVAHTPGTELTVPMSTAVDAVLSTRCEALDNMPKVQYFGPGAIGPR